METKELASGLFICEEPPKPPAKPGIEAYWALHSRCPWCGCNEIESTCAGIYFHDLESHKDTNKAWCTQCTWEGTKHDLIPRPGATELVDEEDRAKARKAFMLLWSALGLSNTSIKLPGLDERRAIWENAAKQLLGYGIPYGETH